MADQNTIPPGSNPPSKDQVSLTDLLNFSQGKSTPPAPITSPGTSGGVDISPLMAFNKGSQNIANGPHVALDDLNTDMEFRRSIVNEQEAFENVAKSGFYLDEHGNKVSTSTLDKASWADRFVGDSFDGVHLARKTTGTADELLNIGNEDKETVKRNRNFLEEITAFIPGGNKLVGRSFSQNNLKPYTDENGNVTLKEFTAKNNEDYKTVSSAYGPQTYKKNFFYAFGQGFGSIVTSLPDAYLSFGQAVKDLIYPNPNSTFDKIMDSMHHSDMLNDNAKDVHSGIFDSLGGFGNFLGTGVATLLEFEYLGGSVKYQAEGVTIGLKAMKLLGPALRTEKAVELAGRLGAAFLLSVGPALAEAKEAGLDPRSAGAMALTTGVVDAVLQEKIGANLVAKYLTKGKGIPVIVKAIRSETEALGGAYDEKTLNKASGNILKRIYHSINDFQNTITEVPIVGPALEGGTQMYVQSLINQSGKLLYNNINEGNPDKTEGHGLYRDISGKDMFMNAWHEGVNAAVLGGLTGAVMHYNKPAEVKSIIPFIIDGKADEVHKAVDWMRSNGEITPEQADAYKNRIIKLEDIFNKNKKAFEDIPDLNRRNEILGAAIDLIDSEFEAKNKIKKATDDLETIKKRHVDENISPTIAQAEIEEQQKQIDIEVKKLELTQNALKDHMPDSDGKLPIDIKAGIRSQFEDHFINTHLTTTEENEKFAKPFARYTLTKLGGDEYDNLVDNLYKDKKETIEQSHKDQADGFIESVKPDIQGFFEEYVKIQTERVAEEKKSLAEKITNTELYTDETLAEMLKNDQLTGSDQKVIEDEINTRRNNANLKKPKYDVENPINKAIAKKVDEDPSFIPNINNIIKYPTLGLENMFLHPEISIESKNAIEAELKTRKENEKVNNETGSENGQEDGSKKGLPVGQDNGQEAPDKEPIQTGPEGGKEDGQTEEEKLKQAADDEEANEFKDQVLVDPTKEDENPEVDKPGKRGITVAEPSEMDMDDFLKTEHKTNKQVQTTRISAFFIAFNSLLSYMYKGRIVDHYDEDGKLVQNPFSNKKLNSPEHFQIGHKVFIRAVSTYEEAKSHGYKESEAQFKKDQSSHETMVIGIYDNKGDGKGGNEHMGDFPTVKNIKRNKNSPADAVEQAINTRKEIFDDFVNGNGRKKLFTSIIDKTTGILNFNSSDRKLNGFQSIYKALGGGKKLANDVQIGIGVSGQLMRGRNNGFTHVLVNGKVEDGYVYASVKQANNNNKRVLVPLSISKVGHENAVAVLKLIQAHFNPKGKLRRELEKSNVFSEVDINNVHEVLKAIGSIIYIRGDKDTTKVPGDHLFTIGKKNGKTVISLGELETDEFDVKSLFESTSSREVIDRFLETVANKYRTVDLDEINKTGKYRSWEHKDGRLQSTVHDSYMDFLDDKEVLTTNLQGFEVEPGSNDFTFTSQPVVQLDGTTTKEIPKEYKKKGKTKTEQAEDTVVEPVLVPLPAELEAKATQEAEAADLYDGASLDDLKDLVNKTTSIPPVFSLSPGEDDKKDGFTDHIDNIRSTRTLFVNDKEFSIEQQKAVINGFLSTIHRLVNYLGITGEQELLAGVKNDFIRRRNMFRKAALTEPAFKGIAENFDKVLEPENYHRFEKFALAELKRMGVEFKKDTIDYNNEKLRDEQGLDNSADTTMEFADSTHDNSQHEESKQWSESQLNKASAKLRYLLSFIPHSYFQEDSNGNHVLKTKLNGFMLADFIPVNILWGKLLNISHELKPGDIMGKLSQLGENDPVFQQIFNLINNHPDESVKNEFQVLMSKQQAGFIAVLVGKEDGSGKKNIKLLSPNRTDVHNMVFKDWIEGFKHTSDLVKVNSENNRYIDTAEGKRIKEAYDKTLASIGAKKNPDQVLVLIQQTLGKLGIEVSDNFLTHIKINGVKFNNKKLDVDQFSKEFSKILLHRLAGGYSESNEGDGGEKDLFDAHNPFTQEGNFMKALARVEAAANTRIYETSYVGGDGKARYSYVNNSYLSNLVKSITADGSSIVDALKKIPYSADSMWLQNWIDTKQSFKLEYFDTLGVEGSSIRNKLMKNMSEAEKEWARAGLFQNNNAKDFSKYFIPIPGDKTVIPVITAMRIDVPILIDGIKRIINKETKAMDHLFNVFKSEHDRIAQVQKLIAEEKLNPPAKSHQLAGYHYGETIGDGKGMGEKFLCFPEFNINKKGENTYPYEQGKVFNEDGTIRPINKDHVVESIQDFFSKEIRKQEEIWIKLDMVDSKNPEQSAIFDKRYHKQRRSESMIPNFAAEYTVNQFLFNFNYTQVIGGDPALFCKADGKADIKATWTNYNKRMVKDMAPGLDPIFTRSTKFNVIFLKDIKGQSSYASTYSALLTKLIGAEAANKAYKNMNITDAQEYTTLQEHLEVMEAMGQLTPEIRSAGNRLLSGGTNPQDISAILNPMKPVYVGDLFDLYAGVARKYYFKTSSFPLIPGLVEGTPLNDLRLHMENHVDADGKSDPIHRAIYESGVKLGLENSSLSMSMAGDLGMTVGDINSTHVHQLDREGFRIQQDVPYHGPSHATEGTQGRRLINSNLEKGESIYTMGAMRTRDEVHEIFEGLHAQKIEISWNELSKTFKIASQDESGTKYKITNLIAFKKLLMDEAVDRGYAVNEMVGLNLVENKKTGEAYFKVPLAFNPATTKYEAIMNSIFNNRVIKQDLPGNTYVQGSSAGFKFTSDLSNNVKNEIIHVDPSQADQPLKFFSYVDGEGKKNQVAECYIPSFFKNSKGEIINLRDVDMNNIPDELLHLFGYRIPTQGLNSMMVFKVKGFLPGYMGDLLIVPHEITEQMGSDFDVDKMFMHHFNYTEENGVFKKIENLNEDELKNIPSVNNKERLENTILQHYMDRFHYADEKTSAQILETNGYGDLEKLNNEIGEAIGKEDGNFLLARVQNEFHERNIDGVAGKGIFSLYSVFHQLAGICDLSLGTTINFNVDGIDHQRTGFEIENVHKGYSSSVIARLQSAAVDNARYQYLSGLNINPLTMGVAGLIASAGYDESHIAYFLSQPIIREYVKNMAGARDLTNNKYDPKATSKVIDELFAKYGKDLDEKYSPGVYERIRMNQNQPKKIYSLEEMKAEINSTGKFDPRTQIDMMINFIRYKEQSLAVDKVISAADIQKGIGANYIEFEGKIKDINELDFLKEAREGKLERINSLTQIDNVQNIFKPETIIGKIFKLAKNYYNAITDFFPYNNAAYRMIKESIMTHSNLTGEIREEYLKKLYGELNSFILSNTNIVDGEEIFSMRKRLMFDFAKTEDQDKSKSLGTRLKEYKKLHPENALLQRLEVISPNNTNDPVEIHAINTPSAIKSDNVDEALRSFSALTRGTELEQELAKDLIKYFITTGGNFNPTSLSRFIPPDILEDQYKYSAKLRDQIKKTENSDYFNKFLTQYFRHNPEKAFAIQDTAKERKTVTFTDNKIVVSHFNKSLRFIKGVEEDNTNNESYPSYLSKFNPRTQRTELYVLTEIKENQNRVYQRINLLGKANFNEYDFNEEGNTKSVIAKNRVANLDPSQVIQDTPIRHDDPVNDKREKEVIDIHGLRENMGTNEHTPTRAIDVLDTLIDRDTTPDRLKTLIRDLRQIISPDVMVHEVAMLDKINGWYDHNDKTIHVNTTEFLQNTKKGPTVIALETLIHEMLHAITKEQFANPHNLTPKQAEAYARIKVIYDYQVKQAKNKAEFDKFGNRRTENAFTRFMDIVTRKISNAAKATKRLPQEEISEEDESHYKKHFDEYYPLTSMDEMVSGLSESAFSKVLRDHTTNENWWAKLFNHAMDFLGLNFKNDWEALHHSILAMHDHESNYKYGWDNANHIVSKDLPTEESTNEPPSKGFDNVRAEDQDPNATHDESNFSLGKKLTTPELAINEINRFFKGNTKGFLPKATNEGDVLKEVARYNEEVGYDALILQRNSEGSIFVAKTSAAMFSLSKGADTEPVKSSHEKISERLITKLKEDNGKLGKRLSSTSDKNRVLGIMAFNNKQIAALEKTTRLTQVIDSAKKHMDWALANLKNNVLDINQLNEIESITKIFSHIDNNDQFNAKNAEYNKKVKEVRAYSENILHQINKLKYSMLVDEFHKTLDLPSTTDYDEILNGAKIDVKNNRAQFLTASRSKSLFIRLGGAMIAKAKQRITADYKLYEEHVYKVFTNFLENGNKDYDILLQHDKNGKRTGKLLSEYSSEYDDAIREATKNKKRKEFLRDNMDVIIPKEGQDRYDKDLAMVKMNHPEWNVPNTLDHGRYNAFVKFNDPQGYVAAIRAAEEPTQTHATKYIQESPKARWRDPLYDELLKKGENSPEVKLYKLVRDEFNEMNLKYTGRTSMNRIPEITKSLIGFMTTRNFKGAFNLLKGGIIDSFTSTIDPILKEGSYDKETGKVYSSIPVYMMSDFLKPSDKTYDLKRVLLTAKMQDIAIGHKQRVEPYLNHMSRILADSRAYMMNNADQHQMIIDENGNQQHGITKGSGLENTQMQYSSMLDDFLYDKGTKSAGIFAPSADGTNTMDENNQRGMDENGDFKGPKDKRYFSLTRSADAINALTRSTGLIFNVPAAINNCVFGFSSNYAYAAGGGPDLNLGDAVKANGIILASLTPGTPLHKKVKLFSEKFGIQNQLNEVRFHRIKGKDVENPLAHVNLHWMSEEGEYLIQNHLGIAMALHYKIGKSNAFDGFDLVNGELKWNTAHGPDPFADENIMNKFCAKIKDAIFQNHGNYEETIQFKREWYGRQLMTYKTWIPELMLSKFGSETIGLDGTLEKGQLISVADILKGADGVKSVQATMANLYSLVKRDPTLGSLKPIDRINIKRSIASFIMTVGLMTVGVALKAGIMEEKDKNKKAKLIFLLNIANRNLQDMSFFYKPTSFTQLFSAPIPSIGTLNNLIAIFPALCNAVVGNDTKTKGIYRGQSGLGRAIIKASPIFNAGQKIETASRQTFTDR